jgi:hypothetical protein
MRFNLNDFSCTQIAGRVQVIDTTADNCFTSLYPSSVVFDRVRRQARGLLSHKIVHSMAKKQILGRRLDYNLKS